MRLKYQSLIALGISAVIFSGCTTSSGGFLNLGITDALRKSRACIFKQKLGYSKTSLGTSGLSLPTFGSKPTLASGPVIVDSYTIPQEIPTASQGIPGDCNCNAGQNSVLSTQEYYMPHREYVNEAVESYPSEIISPPIDTVPGQLLEDAELPQVNPLPLHDSVPAKGNNYDDLDTEGTFEPLGLNEDDDARDDDEAASQEKIVDGQSDNDQSIFESAALEKRSKIKFDTVTAHSQKRGRASEQNSTMLTLHARPAQSHNVFDQEASKRKSIETMQASHKRNFRQQNALRQLPNKLQGRGYRQARNTSDEINFKPLPPVSQSTPVPVLLPKTKQAPLLKTDINRDTSSEKIQNGKTRTADAASNQTVKADQRVPLLRATTVSTASILSLKNLANVIKDDDAQKQRNFYETNRHTAQGKTSTSVDVLNSSDPTIEPTIER